MVCDVFERNDRVLQYRTGIYVLYIRTVAITSRQKTRVSSVICRRTLNLLLRLNFIGCSTPYSNALYRSAIETLTGNLTEWQSAIANARPSLLKTPFHLSRSPSLLHVPREEACPVAIKSLSHHTLLTTTTTICL